MIRDEKFLPKVALAACAIMLAAACGQKSGVADQAVAGGYLVTQNGEVVAVDEEGNVVDPTTGEIVSGEGSDLSSGGGSAETPSVSGDTSTGSNDGSTPDAEDPSESDGAPEGGDATGVSDDVIKVGVHAPITGAAPVPSDSATKGAQLYWRWLERNGEDIFGRRVEVVLRNDNYNPSQAVSVCREMVESDEVFILSGVAGADQIQACARYAGSVGVPYLSAGVTEIGLSAFPTYFAVSMSYPKQATLLTQMLMNRLGAKNEKNGMVWFNTATFRDGHDAFAAEMRKAGAALDYDRAVPKSASASDAQAVITDMNQQGIENVNVLTSPVFFLQLLQAASGQNYRPQWVGYGITMTFDSVATVGCRQGTLDGAKFFSPFPGWVDSNKFDQNFRRAVQEIYPEKREGDDFMWLAWMSSKGLHGMLELVGKDLTRERFVWFLERAKNLDNGIGPPLSFSPDDHFGARTTHVNEAQCDNDSRWHTIEVNRSRF